MAADSPKILLVDDDPMITEPLARALGEAGYGVRTAYTGPAGLALALSERPALVVLDVMLPEMDGWQVCQELRRRSTVPILMLTAQQTASSEWQGGDLRVNFETRQVWKAGKELTLRHKEFELLSFLLSRQGEVVTRAELFDEVWGTDWLGDTRTLDVHMRWLREKIEDDPSNPHYIRTVRGVGYRFVRPETAGETL